MTTFAALVYAAATLGAIAFQVALAAGAPLGEYAMGGRYPGRLPPRVRVAAVVQALILGLLAAVVFSASGVALPLLSDAAAWLIWVAVAFAAVSTVLNAITRSKRERVVWLPVALVLLSSSLIIAVNV